MESFSTAVSAKLKNYVYRLIDPRNGETFYIGRGTNNRVFSHIKMQIKFDKSSDLNDVNEITEKFKTLREILSSGLEPLHIIHRHGMEEGEAREVESALIDAFSGLTNIVSGYKSNEFGPANSSQLISLYESPVMSIPHNHKIIAISINNTFNNRSVYDSVRHAWKIDIKRAKKADYIFAMIQGRCVEVFIVKEWLKANHDDFKDFQETDPKRYAFNGYVAPHEIQIMYNKKRLPSEMQRKKGMSNPIQYKNL